MLKENKGHEMVMTLVYPDPEHKELKGIPPQGKEKDNLRVDIMTDGLQIEIQEGNEMMVFCKALAYSEKEQAIVEIAERNGIKDVPVGRTQDRDEGR